MTDLPPIEYLDEAARALNYKSWEYTGGCYSSRHATIAHARALHQLAQARAEIAALKPRETLEQVARREAILGAIPEDRTPFRRGFLRGAQMQRDGVLPDE